MCAEKWRLVTNKNTLCCAWSKIKMHGFGGLQWFCCHGWLQNYMHQWPKNRNNKQCCVMSCRLHCILGIVSMDGMVCGFVLNTNNNNDENNNDNDNVLAMNTLYEIACSLDVILNFRERLSIVLVKTWGIQKLVEVLRGVNSYIVNPRTHKERTSKITYDIVVLKSINIIISL